jgi:hypothetical protein
MKRSRVSRLVLVAVFSLFLGPSGLVWAQETAAPQEERDPTDGSKDVDQVVPFAMERVHAAAKQALATYGCDIKKERPDNLECTRSRHVGVFVGSGGEKVTVQLSAKDGGTRVQVKTGKGFVGRLGKKNWSTPVFAEMERLLRS